MINDEHSNKLRETIKTNAPHTHVLYSEMEQSNINLERTMLTLEIWSHYCLDKNNPHLNDLEDMIRTEVKEEWGENTVIEFYRSHQKALIVNTKDKRTKLVKFAINEIEKQNDEPNGAA